MTNVELVHQADNLAELRSAAPLRGNVDGVFDGYLTGWVYNEADLAQQISVDIYVDDVRVGQATAGEFRKDLSDANLPNSYCAFWFRIPDDLRDGREHAATVKFSDFEHVLARTPTVFVCRPVSEGEHFFGDALIPNPGFLLWPYGTRLSIREQKEEFIPGWSFDWKKGTSPDLFVFLADVSGLGLAEPSYALGIRVSRPPQADGYVRLLARLNRADFKPGQSVHFSSAWQPMTGEIGSTVTIGEIFIGARRKDHIRRLQTVLKPKSGRFAFRVQNIPVVIEDWELDKGESAILCFSVTGSGTLRLADITLKEAPYFNRTVATGLTFEDRVIQNQTRFLKLGRLWTNELVAHSLVQTASKRLDRNGKGKLAEPYAVVIPVHNAIRDVADLATSLKAGAPAASDIVFVDDGSRPAVRDVLSRLSNYDPRIRVLINGINAGYTRSINRGVQSTAEKFVVILNSDTILPEQSLDRLVSTLIDCSDAAGAGPLTNAGSFQSVPRVRNSLGEWITNRLPAQYSLDDFAEAIRDLSSRARPEFPILNGFCTAWRHEDLYRVGYFDDRLFPLGYGEENDICLRLRMNGRKLLVADDVFVYHKKSRSFGASRRAELSRDANQKLRERHRTTDFSELEREMSSCGSLNELRERILQECYGEAPFIAFESPSTVECQGIQA